MPVTYLILGLFLGGVPAAVIAWLLASRRQPVGDETALALANERVQQAENQRATLTAELDRVRSAHHLAENEKAGLVAELSGERRAVGEKNETLARVSSDLAAAQRAVADRDREAATLTAQIDAEKANVASHRKLLDESSVQLRDAFAKLSRESLDASSKTFLELARENFGTLHARADGELEKRKTEIASLLQPVNQQLTEYRASLAKIEEARNAAYTDLKSQLASVATTQQNLGRETSQLVQALRKPQGRGRWGEVTLRRLFELAGLADRVSFTEQVSVDDGKKRPDCVVDLPEGRQVIVDSKAVIDAFLDAADCVDETQRVGHLKRHATQVKTRVDELSSKAYWNEFAASTDYVVLFLPGEAFLYAAVEHDPGLIEHALKSKVILAAPSSLLGLLKVIEFGWRQKQIEQNATEIRKQGEDLYNRVATMAEHFDRLGSALSTATKAYNETLGSLERSVIPQARKMTGMGVKGRKAIPNLVEIEESPRDKANVWKEFATSDNEAIKLIEEE